MRRLNLLPALLISACTTAPAPETPSMPSASPAAAPAVQAASAVPAPVRAAGAPTTTTSSRLLGRPIRALPSRPLNLQTQCRFENETGYHGSANVEVANGQVKRLNAVFNVPERGQCLIDLASLRQTKSLPSVELRDAASGCTARMWEQGDQATVSFTGCASYCSDPDAFKYVWPILIKRSSGSCS